MAGQLGIGEFNIPAQVLQFSAGEGKVVRIKAVADLLAPRLNEPIVDWQPVQTDINKASQQISRLKVAL